MDCCGASLTNSLMLLTTLAVVTLWSGAWAVANKLFGSQLQFWRHVRIACAAVLVADELSATTLAEVPQDRLAGVVVRDGAACHASHRLRTGG